MLPDNLMREKDMSTGRWSISETNVPDDGAVERLGGAFLLGNGYLGYRGTLEEYTKEQLTATIISGLYDKVDNLWREPVNMPNPLHAQVVYGGVRLNVRTAEVERHSQTLDLLGASHTRCTRFKAVDGNSITVRSTRFVSLAALHLMCMSYTVEASRNCTLVIRTGIDGDVWDLNGPHLERFSPCALDDVISLTAFTREKGVPIAVSQSVESPEGNRLLRREEKSILREIELSLHADAPQTVTVFSALHTGMDGADPLNAGRALSREASRIGLPRLFEEHRARWEERWTGCGIAIEGDRDAEFALRFSMYHLLAVAPTHSEHVSIPARGLSGQMYKGAVFWDTEIFMVPFFAHTFPEIARNLLLYRYHTLDGARRKAREYGFRGAYYAWESQDSGDDACTLFNVTDVFTGRPMRTYFRDKQIHISADVVYAFWRYFSLTRDESILLEGGAEVIYECSRFLLTHLYYSRERERFEILDVTGPDEYHERIHNNAYTNRMTASAFDICLRVSAILHERHPDRALALMERIGFTRDLQEIRDVRGQIYLPQPDSRSSVIPQFDGYFGLEDVSVEELLARRLHPNEYFGGGSGLAVSTQVIKQADVILGMSLFSNEHSREVKTANWEYYEPRTEHGSSLSACAYALVAAEIGKIESARQYFMKAACADLSLEPRRYVGTLYIGGTHPASSGGAWMAAVFGLCGIGFSGDVLTIEPRLPDHWAAVKVPLVCRGRKLHITVAKDRVRIESPAVTSDRHSLPAMDVTLPLSEKGRLSLTLKLPELEG